MSHSYVSCRVHCVFSTKERRRCITADHAKRLFPYLAGVARTNRIQPIAVGGVADHVHLLVTIPGTLPIAKAMQLIKGNSSRWIHETFPELWDFAWQEGYGAFSIGVSQTAETVAYIERQAMHHKNITFREEVIGFLEKHGVAYDPRYVWD